MLAEIWNFELEVAAFVTIVTVTLPSVAFACLLTLWYGRRIRPSVRAAMGIALAATLPWAGWLTALMLIADSGDEPFVAIPLMLAYLVAGLMGSVPAALFTRRAAVMSRGRRAEDR